MLIPAITECKRNQLDRNILALPVRLGGLGLGNPSLEARREYASSVKVTDPCWTNCISVTSITWRFPHKTSTKGSKKWKIKAFSFPELRSFWSAAGIESSGLPVWLRSRKRKTPKATMADQVKVDLFHGALNFVLQFLGLGHLKLKEKQYEVLKHVVLNNKDVWQFCLLDMVNRWFTRCYYPYLISWILVQRKKRRQ